MPDDFSECVLEAVDLVRHFHAGSERVAILDGLNLQLHRSDRVAIMGASGCGKTTLLHLLAGMDRPDSGLIKLAGEELSSLAEPALTRLRARHVGLVFQDFNLIDSLTVAENIRLPLWLNKRTESPALLKALSETLAIEHLLERLPASLSGGEKQRVAIARAMIHQPDVILADEPTGSLDETNSARVLELFDQVIADGQATLLMVTHSEEAARLCQRRLILRNGRLHPSA